LAKTNTTIKIQRNLLENVETPDKLISKLLDYLLFLDLEKININDNDDEVSQKLSKLREEYKSLTLEYSKLRKEYGVLFFEGSELYKRNTLAALKLSNVKLKLNRVKAKLGDSSELDYEEASSIIKAFYNRYLSKKE